MVRFIKKLLGSSIILAWVCCSWCPSSQPEENSALASDLSLSNKLPRDLEWNLIEGIASGMPHIPLKFLFNQSEESGQTPKSCAQMPKLFELRIDNEQWQAMPTRNGTLYLFRAYHDARALEKRGPVVRILAMMDRVQPSVRLLCQFWSPGWFALAKVIEFKYIWVREWGNHRTGVLQPYLITCPLTPNQSVPLMVSLVESECDQAENALTIFNHPSEPTPRGRPPSLAVCTKGLDFPLDDLSVRLVEWLEVLRALGVNKVFAYELAVHPNVKKVLAHYIEQGLVDLTPLSLPGSQPNGPILRHLYLKHKVVHKRQNEIIPYNDCLYRNLLSYTHLALLDIDEVVVPLRHDTWHDMLTDLIRKAAGQVGQKSSICFRNVYFLDNIMTSRQSVDDIVKDIPEHFHMLSRVYRSSEYSRLGFYSKCFHDVQRVKTLHNHFPLSCLTPTCSSIHVEVSIGHLQHYRKECVAELSSVCNSKYKNKSVVEPRLLNWKYDVMARSNLVLKQLFGS